MKIVKLVLIIVFALSLIVFGVSEIIVLSGRDTTDPVIESDREVVEIPCAYTQEQLMEGMSAFDKEDGDLTAQIVTGPFSRFISKGVCNLTYVVFDSADRSASLTRNVHFTDYHSPRFTLTKPLVFQQQEGSHTEVMKRLGAEDILDGDLKDWITQTDTDVNYSSIGSYPMSVEVTNSFGDTSTAVLPVHVVSRESQQVQINLKENIIYIQQGTNINPMDYINDVTDYNGMAIDISRVSVESGVDVNTPGCYEIHYTVPSGTGETWLIVIVEGEDE